MHAGSIRVIAGAGDRLLCSFVDCLAVRAWRRLQARTRLASLMQAPAAGQVGNKTAREVGGQAREQSLILRRKKRAASTKPAAKESTFKWKAPQVTAPPSGLVIDGEAMRAASPNDANDIDLAANAEGAPARRRAVGSCDRRDGGEHRDDQAPWKRISQPGAAAVAQDAEQQGYRKYVLAGCGSSPRWAARWRLGSLAWFLIGPSASADV